MLLGLKQGNIGVAVNCIRMSHRMYVKLDKLYITKLIIFPYLKQDTCVLFINGLKIGDECSMPHYLNRFFYHKDIFKIQVPTAQVQGAVTVTQPYIIIKTDDVQYSKCITLH